MKLKQKGNIRFLFCFFVDSLGAITKSGVFMVSKNNKLTQVEQITKAEQEAKAV